MDIELKDGAAVSEETVAEKESQSVKSEEKVTEAPKKSQPAKAAAKPAEKPAEKPASATKAPKIQEEVEAKEEPKDKPAITNVELEKVAEVAKESVKETKEKEESLAGTVVSLKGAKLWRTPDVSGQFRIFEGNVKVIDATGATCIVEYMKPGFGMVRGFVAKEDIK